MSVRYIIQLRCFWGRPGPQRVHASSTQYTAHPHSTVKCNLSVTLTKSSPWRWPSRVETCRSVLQLMKKLSLCICWWLVFLYNIHNVGKNTEEVGAEIRLLNGSNICRVARYLGWAWYVLVASLPRHYIEKVPWNGLSAQTLTKNQLKQITIIKSLTVLSGRQITSRRQNHTMQQTWHHTTRRNEHV
jgi:hypothetical protein